MHIHKTLNGILLLTSVVLILSCNDQMGSGSGSDAAITNEFDSVSYAIGIDIATSLKRSGFDSLNTQALAKGFADIYEENPDAMDARDANNYVMTYMNKERQKVANENLAEAEKFLAENKDKPGVLTTESGLQYKVLEEGNGPKPTMTDQVKVMYKGTRINGEQFDATEDGNPAQFRVNGVIKGWSEGLQLMSVGSKWEFYIHPNLGYGMNPPRGADVIQANDLLIFEVELLEIVEQ
jgi:FKBP-type peptidyl-prolyl cis-trans isomerase FklB